MRGTVRHSAIALGLFGMAAAPAWATIDVSPAPSSEQSDLFLRGHQVKEMPPPAVIYYEGLYAPYSYPGGCFNCPTLPSNSGNLAGSLSRAHSFSQDLFAPDGRRIFLFGN